MRSTLKRWGNSTALRIPASILESASLAVEDAVEIREEHGRIIIEPAVRRDYDLDTLVSQITRKNRHSEIETGDTVGKEVW